MSYKWCAVPKCSNTTIKTPEKLFLSVPKNVEVRRKWLKLSRRDPKDIANSSTIFFCEDHFHLENDMANYYQHKMGFSRKIILKDKILPSKFHCQPDRIKRMRNVSTFRSAFVKLQRMELIKQCEDIEQSIITNDETSVTAVQTCTKERGRDFSTHKAILKQRSKQPLATDAIVEITKEDIRSTGLSVDDQVPEPSEIRTIKRREKSSKATRRWGKKKKGVCESSKQQTKPAAQRMREYREGTNTFPTDAFIEDKRVCTVQTERSDCGWMPTKSSTICSTHLKQEDKCTTLKEFMPLKTTAVPVIEDTVAKEDHVNDDGNRDTLKNIQSPDHSEESCLQTMLKLKRKIKEEFDLVHGQHDGILGIFTHVEIKQEDLEDADAYVPNLSPAASSQTNTDCGSKIRESHVENFAVYEAENTMDVTAFNEEPGSPLSDVSIHSDAVDSQQAIKIKLRNKMEMLYENEKILYRLRREVSIYENKYEELLTDIKYLRNKSKNSTSPLT